MANPSNTYDLIVYGDEVPGILGLVSAAREYYRRMRQYPRTLLMVKSNAKDGLGGTLVRGELAYLDRSSLDWNFLQSMGLPTFGDPANIYKEFLKRAEVDWIALDPKKGDAAARWMLGQVGAQILSNVRIESTIVENSLLTGIKLRRGDTYWGKQFIDATVNAELAQFAGVRKLKGYETFGLPESELPVTLCFQTEGLSIPTLKQVETSSLTRFSNPRDLEAQHWLDIAAGFAAELATILRGDLFDAAGRLKTLYQAKDFVDIRSRALSIAYHSFRQKKWSLAETGSVFDNGNVAVLPQERLSWNSLLFYVNGTEAEKLARTGAKPTPAMEEEMDWVATWIKKAMGATSVKPATELYIRHAGNVTGVVEPLTGTKMLEGGVPDSEALASFSYHFDVRGGITGLGAKGREKGYSRVGFHTKPIFNVGIRHAQIRDVPNLAVVSPASGFEGYASSAGRIVEFNVAVAQGLGIASAIALIENRNLAEITNLEVRKVLVKTGQLPRIYGQPNPEAAAKMRKFEADLVIPPSSKPTSPLPILTPTQLTDIREHWAQEFIQPLFEKEYLQGFGDRTFRPQANLTRAEYAAIVAKTFDFPLKSEPIDFFDVSSDFWGADAITKATRMGFISGFPNGTFRPQKNLTRTEALVALVSGLVLVADNTDILEFYLDRNQIPSYATRAIAAATQHGLVVNHPHRQRLNPLASIRRAEVAATIYQALVLKSRMPAILSPYIADADIESLNR
ncbi:S-layer homology domain-containing protein [Oscillatoriales cyanobacterium LEGE 11467]|uniref:S-layer homology domain-containing protein n=1 Tax=Zarconia navalis LEGE 11467 TaxID=1828826 RepID=A0A928Z7P3_9CYAN|nr:S-layer homology domain-containing protein [Zarconia navalis]MBE9040750.1 S-layer homology domain-containing protein [Zarconia navalis LEGE 11467]